MSIVHVWLVSSLLPLILDYAQSIRLAKSITTYLLAANPLKLSSNLFSSVGVAALILILLLISTIHNRFGALYFPGCSSAEMGLFGELF
jgi:hypothetical protein